MDRSSPPPLSQKVMLAIRKVLCTWIGSYLGSILYCNGLGRSMHHYHELFRIYLVLPPFKIRCHSRLL